MKICPKCGNNNDDFARFCSRCGERLDYSSYGYATDESLNFQFNSNSQTGSSVEPGSSYFDIICPICNSRISGQNMANTAKCNNCGTIIELGEINIKPQEFLRIYPDEIDQTIPKQYGKEFLNLAQDETVINLYNNLYLSMNKINKSGPGSILISDKKIHINLGKFKLSISLNSLTKCVLESTANRNRLIIYINVPDNIAAIPNLIEMYANSTDYLNLMMKSLNFQASKRRILIKLTKKESTV